MTVFKDWEKYTKHGVFAALFISLLALTMLENRQREADYRKVIQQQVDANMQLSDLIKVDLAEIKGKLAEGR